MSDSDEFENKLHKTNVDWFDVSRKYFLYNIEGKIELWPRQDTAVECIWQTTANDNVKYYVDDVNLYEFKDGNVITRDLKKLDRIMSTTPNVWRVWKGTSVVLELENAIQINSHQVPITKSIMCADANRQYLIYYDAESLDPHIEERVGFIDRQEILEDSDFIDAEKEVKKLIIELNHTVCGKINENTETILQGIKENRKPILDQMNAILTDIKQNAADISEAADYISKNCVSVQSLTKDFSEAASDNETQKIDSTVLRAMELSANDFMQFCIDAKLKDNTEKISEETLIKLVPQLLGPLDSDPNRFAEIMCNTILQIDTFDKEKNNKEKLKKFGDDLLATTVGLFQRLPETAECQRYIRLLMNIGVSLKR